MAARIRKLAVGLGNPGPEYQRTRHNLGFLAMDRYSERSRRKPERLACSTAVLYRKGEILLAKPTTYMNRSGMAVAQIIEKFHLNPEECLIVYDDYSLSFGTLRARHRGGAGGHHGMESIIAVLGTEEIPRLRLGIAAGLPLEDLTDHVLSEFTQQEERVLEDFLARAAKAIDCFFHQDIQAVMNQFNG